MTLQSYFTKLANFSTQNKIPIIVGEFGVTLGKAPWSFDFQPTKFGHVWTADQTPGYEISLNNHTGQGLQGKLSGTIRPNARATNTPARPA